MLLIHCNCIITHFFIVNICLLDCGSSPANEHCLEWDIREQTWGRSVFLTSESLESRSWIITEWFVCSFGLFISGPLNVMRVIILSCCSRYVTHRWWCIYLSILFPRCTSAFLLSGLPWWEGLHQDWWKTRYIFSTVAKSRSRSGDSFCSMKPQPAELNRSVAGMICVQHQHTGAHCLNTILYSFPMTRSARSHGSRIQLLLYQDKSLLPVSH